MNNKNVDSDKIVNHIKYTRHWLDKAHTDFLEQRFAEGSVILNIARAELTAAWEEVMHLKTQVTTTMPRKARDNWKPLSSVGLLAAGFMISMFVTKLTTVTVPSLDSALNTMPAHSDVMLVREEAAPTIAEETQYVPNVMESAQSGQNTSSQNTAAETNAGIANQNYLTNQAQLSNETQSHVQSVNPAQKNIKKRTVQFTGTSAQKSASQTNTSNAKSGSVQSSAIDSSANEASAVENNGVVTFSAGTVSSADTSASIGTVANAVAGDNAVVENSTAEKTGSSEEVSLNEKTASSEKITKSEKQKPSQLLHQNDIIDLFSTARKALHK